MFGICGFLCGLPLINQICRLIYVIDQSLANKSNADINKMLLHFAFYEVIGESTPQFIAQVSYIIRFGNVGLLQIGCIVISFCSIFRLVAAFSINNNANVFTKVGASAVIAIGSGLKLFLCAIIVANLRYYAFVILVINGAIMAPIALCTRGVGWWKYLLSIFNFGVQVSPMSGTGRSQWIGLLQWMIMLLNVTASLLMPYYLAIFPGESPPALIEIISPVILLTISVSGILVVSLIVELLSVSYLKDAWN